MTRRAAAIALYFCSLAFNSTMVRGESAPATQPAVLTSQPANSAVDRDEAFVRRNLVEAYETVGHRDPKWDASARKAIAFLARQWMLPQPDPDLYWQMAAAANEAVNAGCDDQEVLYAALLGQSHTVRRVNKKVLNKLDAAIPVSSYSPYVKIFALYRLAQMVDHRPDAAKQLAHLRQQVYDNLPGALAQQDVRIVELADICAGFTFYGPILDGDRKVMIDKVSEIMTRAKPDSPVADLFKESAYWKYAWDVPGAGAPEVPGARHDRHVMAEEACRAALMKDPHCAAASEMMVGIICDEDGDPQELEDYFQRAIHDDPDCYWAYHYKFAFLNNGEPGSEINQLLFGRYCLATNRWAARVPFLLLRVHQRLADARSDELRRKATTVEEDMTANDRALAELYRTDPSAWDDVVKLYDGYLAYRPGSIEDRCNYTNYAIMSDHLDLALQQLRILEQTKDPVAVAEINTNFNLRPALEFALAIKAMTSQANGDFVSAKNQIDLFNSAILPSNLDCQKYGQIWTYIVQCHLDNTVAAAKSLQEYQNKHPSTASTKWVSAIIDLMLGKCSEKQLLAQTHSRKDNVVIQWEKECRAWFYIGKMHELAGEKAVAIADYKKSVETCRTTLLEYKAAQAELEALKP